MFQIDLKFTNNQCKQSGTENQVWGLQNEQLELRILFSNVSSGLTAKNITMMEELKQRFSSKKETILATDSL